MQSRAGLATSHRQTAELIDSSNDWVESKHYPIRMCYDQVLLKKFGIISAVRFFVVNSKKVLGSVGRVRTIIIPQARGDC